MASDGICRHYDILDSLDINDVFPKLPSYFKANDTQAAIDRKETVDMSKVSDNQLNMTVLRLRAMYENMTGYNSSTLENFDDVVVHEMKIEVLNMTRRSLLNKTRRQGLPWFGYKDLSWDWASEHITRQRMLDGMLTLIYMARHHMKTMAVQQVSAPKDDSYRLAYLWTKLQILTDRIIAIYNTMAEKGWTYNWELEWDRPYYFLMLHQKALKIHTQFNFYFWIIARIHHKYSLINQLYQTTPTTQKRSTSTL